VTAVAPTRARLLQAARETVEQEGYRAASVLAVAERAGVAAGTLYRHFASKEDLFVELFRAVCDREVAAMRAAAESMPEDATPAQRIELVLSTFAQRALRRPRLAWALIAEPVDPAVDAERLAYRARYAELVSDALGQAIANRQLPEQDAALTAAALIGGCGEALVGPLAADRPDAEHTVAALRAFVRRAIGA
jgi:AcrR family transcriptional regulator